MNRIHIRCYHRICTFRTSRTKENHGLPSHPLFQVSHSTPFLLHNPPQLSSPSNTCTYPPLSRTLTTHSPPNPLNISHLSYNPSSSSIQPTTPVSPTTTLAPTHHRPPIQNPKPATGSSKIPFLSLPFSFFLLISLLTL